MTSVRDSLGKPHPGPVNQSNGLIAIPASADVSGIVGIPASAITNVDQFTLSTPEGFTSRFDLLAVHLARQRDTAVATREGPDVVTMDISIRKDTGVIAPVRSQGASFPRDTAPAGWARVRDLVASAPDTGQTPAKKKATAKQLVVAPPPPDSLKPLLIRACYEVAPSGEAKLLEWTKSRDADYNAKILATLRGYKFNPATLNGVAVLDTACVKISK
jgi:hypothetical protein